MEVVTYLGSLVHSCCGEGGTLQTNITGLCGECLQCMDHTGFAPAHGAYAFPVFTAQAPGSSAGVLSKAGLGFVHFPGPSSSGNQVIGKCTVPGGLCLNHLPSPNHLVSWVHQESTVSGVPCVSSGE